MARVETGPKERGGKDIQQALDFLRELQGKIGGKDSRIHPEAMELWLAMRRALEIGPCGKCQHLRINFLNGGRKKRVVLKCKAGKSPVALHRITPLGKIPDCFSFTPK